MRCWSSSTSIRTTCNPAGSPWTSTHLAIEADRQFQVHDLLTDARYLWSGARNFVQLDPARSPAHIFRVRRRVRTEHDFDYFL